MCIFNNLIIDVELTKTQFHYQLIRRICKLHSDPNYHCWHTLFVPMNLAGVHRKTTSIKRHAGIYCCYMWHHVDLMPWECLPHHWPLVRGSHWWPVYSPRERPVMRSFNVSLMLARTSCCWKFHIHKRSYGVNVIWSPEWIQMILQEAAREYYFSNKTFDHDMRINWPEKDVWIWLNFTPEMRESV